MSEEYDQGAIDAAKRARDLIEEIVQRCDEAGIEYENSSFEEDFGVVDVVLRVLLPSGRKKREVLLWDVDDLEAFNDIEFEKYVIIGNYAAICRYDQGLIEAVFTIIDERPRPVRFMLRRILKAFGIDLKKDNTFDPRDLPQPDGVQKTAIRISPLSNELKVLTKSPSSYDISITINSKFSTHAEALKLLEKICHSVFFEVEIKNGIAPTLLRRRERRYNFKPLHELDGPAYPKYEYDQGPMSLYWYARSAINMPLLQFLAFYQTIEFYFPVYFKAEINRKVRSIIKDPSFKVERDADVSKLTLALSARAGGYGSEKEQL
ncbi:MAG TPA: hypothetical protein PKZ27_08540, partial [Rhodocyclaceae bacterium]|nr:hypothetical protein [Rhodocyclaceae bacterium]